MAKVLNELERENRRNDIFQRIDSDVENILRRLQDRYGIHNGECPPELAHELDVAMENVVNVMEKILDLQTEIDNRERFYAINFKMQIKATNAEEALDKLKGKIDGTFDIADLLDVKEMEVEMAMRVF